MGVGRTQPNGINTDRDTYSHDAVKEVQRVQRAVVVVTQEDDVIYDDLLVQREQLHKKRHTEVNQRATWQSTTTSSI